MADPIYYNTMVGAIDAALAAAVAAGAEFDETELSTFIDDLTRAGDLPRGRARGASCRVFRFKGKLDYCRTLCVRIYRMDSGRYELVHYIN